MKNLLVYFFLSFLSINLDFLDANAQYLFNKLYDNDSLYDGGFVVIQNMDAGFMVGGTTMNLSGTYCAAYLLKTDSFGDTLWTKSYDLGLGGADYAESIIQLNDSIYILCGETKDTLGIKMDIFLSKIDNIGNVIWLKRYGSLNNNEYSNMVQQTTDSGFIIAGLKYDSLNTEIDAYLIKTDSAGNLQWEKQYGGPLDDYFYAVRQVPDGGYICAGGTVLSAVDGDVYLIRTDSIGDTLWTKRYGGPEADGAFNLNLTSDGGFIIVGGKQISGVQEAYIIKTDSSGTLEWEKTFSKGPNTHNFIAVNQLSNGNYIAGGATYDYSVSPARSRGSLMKLNQDGDSLWSRTYTYYGGDTQDYLYDMKPTSDGDFVFCGMIINNALPQKNDVWVVKTDSLGNTCEIDTTTYEGCSEFICSYLKAGFYANNDTFLLTDTIQFYDTSQYANQWLWDFGDSETDTLQNPVHIYDSAGTYTVTLIITNKNCIDSVCATINVIEDTTGLEELQTDNCMLHIYPNPFKNETHIKYYIPETVLNAKINIYNLSGIKLKTYLLFNGEGEILLRAKDLENGIYICNLMIDGKVIKSEKMVVE